ncbi:MAG: ATP-binding cassette domain-containing protein [Desulfomonile tiedjei]|nr:ATP-binding cassette domain-containing protein [Desulfomonile tiedjei]
MEIRVDKLTHWYNPGTSLQVSALEDVSFIVPAGKVLGILGGTGSGKTTLIKHLNGLLTPTQGRVLLDGKDVETYGPGLGRKVGVVLQRPERQLFDETVFRDISFVLRRFTALDQAEISLRVRRACELVGLDLEAVGDRSPHALSDGEKRKTAIAGVLVNEPDVLVLDEPAVGLDPPSMADVIRLLDGMKQAGDRTIVIVSHDMGPFLTLLDSLLVLNAGRVSAFGSPGEVCAGLSDDPVMRNYLPRLALLVHDLAERGFPVGLDAFTIETLAEQLVVHAGHSEVGP